MAQRDHNIFFASYIFLSFQYFCVAYYNDIAIFVGFSLTCLENLGFLQTIVIVINKMFEWNLEKYCI